MTHSFPTRRASDRKRHEEVIYYAVSGTGRVCAHGELRPRPAHGAGSIGCGRTESDYYSMSFNKDRRGHRGRGKRDDFGNFDSFEPAPYGDRKSTRLNSSH